MRKLTDRVVRAAKGPERGSTYLWDEEIPGFGLRIYSSGRRSFVLRYGGRGQRRLMTLGEWGTLTAHQARQQAIRTRGRVLDGKDPLAEKEAEAQKARTEKADATRFREVATLYLERHAKPHRRSWREDQRRIETYVLPAIGHLGLKNLRPGHIASLHAEIGRAAPVEANRVRELVRAILNKARDWGFVPEGTPNPAAFRKGERFQEQSRERYVTRAELPALWSAIEQESNPYVKAAMKLYLFVGLRKTELLRTRWDEIDLERGEWRVLRTKSGRAHEVPIPEPAAAILRDLPRTAGNPHVFPGARSGRHLVNIDKSWRRVRRTAGPKEGLNNPHLGRNAIGCGSKIRFEDLSER